MDHNKLRAQELRELADRVERGQVSEMVWAMRETVTSPAGRETTGWHSQQAGDDAAWIDYLICRLLADARKLDRPPTPGGGMVTTVNDATGDPASRDIWELARIELECNDTMMRVVEIQLEHWQRGVDALKSMELWTWEQAEGKLELIGTSIYVPGEPALKMQPMGDGYEIELLIGAAHQRGRWRVEVASELPQCCWSALRSMGRVI